MNLPTQQQCLDFFAKYKVPLNIKAHCIAVQKYAIFLAQEFNKHNPEKKLDLELLKPLTLLHDLFKAVALKELKPSEEHPYVQTEEEIAMWKKLRQQYPDMYEGEVAYEVFKDDYPELALSLKKASDPNEKNKSAEEMFAHYVDWRVQKETLVKLKERMDYLYKKYPHNSKYFEQEFPIVEEYERKLFQQLPFSPQQVKEMAEGFTIN